MIISGKELYFRKEKISKDINFYQDAEYNQDQLSKTYLSHLTNNRSKGDDFSSKKNKKEKTSRKVVDNTDLIQKVSNIAIGFDFLVENLTNIIDKLT